MARFCHGAALVLALAFLGLSSSACEKPVKLKLVDTEQRAFDAVCKNGDCTLEGGTPTPTAAKPDGAEAGFVLHRASRYFSVCDVWMTGARSFTINPIDCRLLSCKTDADCPAMKGLPRGSCTNGSCIEPSGAFTSEDAGLLCLAGTGAPAGTSQQIERFALGSNCGSPCRVPTVCRQP